MRTVTHLWPKRSTTNLTKTGKRWDIQTTTIAAMTRKYLTSGSGERFSYDNKCVEGRDYFYPQGWHRITIRILGRKTKISLKLGHWVN